VVELVSQQLEFRGINLAFLRIYFEELGGKQITQSFPYKFEHPNWYAEILSEKEISFTNIIKVNQVHILFHAKNENILTELIKNYRYKTTRVGG
jgi:uncharacterized LabA/DUF88 family protein